ncbi:MAG TPA: OmpA family protein [Polyangiaceae bacterium]
MRTTRTLLAVALTAAVSALGASPARAQSTSHGFNLDTFNPSERGSEWFAEDSLDLRGEARPAIGIVGEYGLHPLVLYNPDGSVRSDPVADQLVLHLGASLVVLDRLRLGLDVPIALFQDGTTGTVSSVTFKTPSSAGLGDLRVAADLRLLGSYGDAFTLAVGAQVFIPTGSQNDYLGDGSVRLLPRLAAGGDIGAFAYAAHVGFLYRQLSDSIGGGSAIGSGLAFGVSAGVHPTDSKNLLIGPELYGTTTLTNGDSAFAARTTPVEAILGFHYLAGNAWRFGAGAGPGLNRSYGEPAVRILLNVEWAPGIEAPPAPAAVAPSDRDKDGVLDDDDACPDVPGVKTDDPKTNGCPPDRDHDGILDADDACPDVPGVKTDDPKTNGCPPDTDRDKDGIPNELDACPDTPGPANKDPKKNGCPAAAVVGKQIVILEQVKFATGSAKILPASNEILQAVLEVLTKHTEIKHLRIEGHTDNVGAAAMNKRLSGARAASVVSWLVGHGVDAGRFTSAGFGMERPIDTNDTPEGRQNNRRVEFHIEDAPPAQ